MTYFEEITQNDISIIMQGAIVEPNSNVISKQFIDNLEYLLKIFHDCQIVVSTWEISTSLKCEVTDKYKQVLFIFSDDIGPISKEVDDVKIVSNVNRMVVSTLAGLNVASRAFAIKIRTDSYFYNDSIISVLNKVFVQNSIESVGRLKRNKQYSIFDSHIVNCNLFARNPHSHQPFLYHPGDILVAGLTIDLKKLFDIPLATSKIIEKCTSFRNTCYMKFVPEQYIWIECIKKIKKMDEIFPGNFNYSQKYLEESECYYVNNFIPFDMKDLGFLWPKHWKVYFNKGKLSVYNLDDWCNLYRKYIINSQQIHDFYYRKRTVLIAILKVYFFVRSSLLRVKFIRKIAYKYFVKRG